jgi:GDPmannose 4,6-dehydratase
MAKTALITGVTGQDGAYLSRLLMEKGYRVFGTERGENPVGRTRLQWLGIADAVTVLKLELTDGGQIQRLLERTQPDEIYNLAAQSFVHSSFEQPIYSGEVTGLAVARILEALRNSHAPTRFYQASTSELYGNAASSPQDEETAFRPRSPYAIAKLYGHHITVNYREAFGLHACCGILFNHESPLRPSQFISRKVTLALARMALGEDHVLAVGNLEAARDWGFAGDYVEGMWRMVQEEEPEDYVLATGEAHTVRQLIETAAAAVDIAIDWQGEGQATEGRDRRTGRLMVRIDPAFYRPTDINLTVGNPAKAARRLGWQARLGFEALIGMMIEADMTRLKTGQLIL